MDKRVLSSLVKGCGALAFVMVAAFAGRDALRSVASLHEADLQLALTEHHLNDVALALLTVQQQQPVPARLAAAQAGLERAAIADPVLQTPVRELGDQVAAYLATAAAAGTETAARIPAIIASIQAAAERRAAVRHASLSGRLLAGLAAAALACLGLGATAAAWRAGSQRAASAGEHAGLLRQALECLPFAMSVVDRSGQPVLVNAAARELWHDQHEAPQEWRRGDLEMRSENRALYQALHTGYSRGRDAVDIVAQDGASQRLIVTAMPLRNALHKVAGAFALYVDGAMQGQNLAPQAPDVPAEPASLMHLAGQNGGGDYQGGYPSQVFVLDAHGVIVAVNQPALDSGGLDCSGANYLDVCDASAARGVPEAARIAAGIRAVLRGDAPTFSMEYACRANADYYWSRATVSRMVDSKVRHVVVVHENITQHKATESALRESALSMRELAEHQESVREEERKRIAREIHDELGQQLLALKIDVSILQGQLSHVPEATAQLEGMLRSMSSLMQSMRAIINDLRPAVLDLGLHAAVEWQTKEFQRKTGISCALMSDGEDIVLSDACATALFRTLQESLTNVSRHASASHVDVQLYATDESLLMRVSDDGIGRLGQQDKPDAFGLRGMRERIGSLGGRLTVTAAPDQGVTVTAVIPIRSSLQTSPAGFDRRSATDRRASARTA